MEILLYSEGQPVRVREVGAAIRKAAPRQRISITTNLGELKQRLVQPKKSLRIAILEVLSSGDLEGLLCLRDLLVDIRIILILPDQDGSTVSMAHRLGPRYLSFPGSDGEDFGMVLGNMVRIYGRAAVRRNPGPALRDAHGELVPDHGTS